MSRRWSLALAVLVAGSLRTPSAIASASCSPDVDGNQVVDFGDVAVVLLDFGPCDGCASDLDGSGVVDFGDAAVVLLEFGSCPSWYTVLEQSPDPTVVYDAVLRSAVIATGLSWRVRDNGTGIEMVLIPSGDFEQGCTPSSNTACFAHESPVRLVTLSRPFYLSRTEVTQAQWLSIMNANPSYFAGYVDSPRRPVERVDWNDVQAFCAITGCRLPTEAEWEYAYRAGSEAAFHGTANYPTGIDLDQQLTLIGWYWNNATTRTTRAVAGKSCNGFGVYDMAGNVAEWCQDWFGVYGSDPVVDPQGPDLGTHRVLRGGSWVSSAGMCRASARDSRVPEILDNGIFGFRVARNP